MLRKILSRHLVAIRLLGLSKVERPAHGFGLVMVQIDGLSKTQFETAVKHGHMPFLKSLLTKEHYVAHTFYSGLPSNTPNVQGELFYGVKGCVPSFSFLDRETAQPIKMFDSAYVENLQAQLQQNRRGLFEGGSAYSNIFTGGAKEGHFCFGKAGWDGVLHAVNPFVLPFLIILYIDVFFRTFVLLVVEFFIALFECIRGTLKGRLFSEELRFVWLRVLVCVFLREVVVIGACMDIMRGLPVVHLNLLGYDEQAHCRGPSSAFAHWSLRGIDDCIKRLDRVTKWYPRGIYDIWVYSDHGQVKTTPYLIRYGRTAEDAIEQLFESVSPPKNRSSGDLRWVTVLQNKPKQTPAGIPFDFAGQKVFVTAMGPLGQVYINKTLENHELEFYARRMVSELHIPLVMMRKGSRNITAFTEKGEFTLPEQAAEVFGKEHPFLDDIKEDVVRMCFHPNAGELTIAGWAEGSAPISFPLEYGAHAGMSIEETRAFALLPVDAPVAQTDKAYLRPVDLRETALRYINRERPTRRAQGEKTDYLRFMSYNVHGCKGMDGHISTERIARVIARQNPDIIALQEIDFGRLRSQGIDQAAKIAAYLEMTYHFHPVFRQQEGEYGNALLSRYPLTLIKRAPLPKLDGTGYEPRGAMWVSLEWKGMKFNVINTHLSIWPRERMLQAEALMTDQWQVPNNEPVILCGDFNAFPGSAVYRRICRQYIDSQKILEGHRPRRTWSGQYPVAQIDHVFLSPHFEVVAVSVPSTNLNKLASDHLPFIADIKIKGPVASTSGQIN